MVQGGSGHVRSGEIKKTLVMDCGEVVGKQEQMSSFEKRMKIMKII